MPLPNPEKQEVIVFRISKDLKDKLRVIAKSNRFNNNLSEALRYLIERESKG